MSEQKHSSILLLFLKNPIIMLGVLLIFSFLGLIFLMINSSMLFDQQGITDENREGIYVDCTEGELNQEAFYSQFENAGVFVGYSRYILFIANVNQIDPVLLTSIMFHETNKGTSNIVINRNNPARLRDRNGIFLTFDSLEEGIQATASYLKDEFIEKNLLSIVQIGNVHAPIGVNDPNNLNIHWIPSVTSIANQLGGLTMNCSYIGTGKFTHPIPTGRKTSDFGTRIHPITGVVSMHRGVDFGCGFREPIYSALGGNVVVAINSGWGGGFGHHVVINHGDKLTLYAHMQDVLVGVGQTVERGQPIGTCGSTGDSTGNHLHFEVKLSLYGQRVDPAPYLDY